MKTATVKTPKKARPDAMTKLITASLRLARADAVKTARMHGTAIIYQLDGKIISERP
ncbi:MAG: hypothetical protein NTU80_13370 [Verrucomicrobia bacterium]|nr:hypothetical protein [Verrucomicrobiota bacterium]